MGVTDFLKKIGILKTWNASGTYTNAAERPNKFVEKDLYDGVENTTIDSSDSSTDE